MYKSIGIYTKGKYQATLGRKSTKEYRLWTDMLTRCYGNKENSYKNCSVSENFLNFQYFAEWCNSQIGFKEEDFALDKDFIFKGNKLYSENTCFFVPRAINNLITFSNAARGEYPLGVSFRKSKNKFESYGRDSNNKKIHLGYFTSETEAFNVYKVHKEKYIKEIADKYKNKISNHLYLLLMEYKIDITD